MPLDQSYLKKAASQQSQDLAIRTERGSDSDFIEAKANITTERLLESGRNMVDANDDSGLKEAQEDIDSGVRQAYIPTEEESGLIDENIALDDSQVAAIKMLVQEQYGCLIGAAGSGKTTSQRFFLHKMIYGDEPEGIEPMSLRMLTGKQGLNVALVAFTGIATQVIKQNMPDWLHPACKTIHSLLEYAPVTTEIIQDNGEMKESQVFMPTRDKVNKLDHELIIIDEASMVGLDLWHQLLDACRPGTKIFLVGDLNQLPPVGSQSMFAYTLSGWPVAELTKIHRQKEAAANRIIETAHQILQGEEFTFDNPGETKNWRVIGFELKAEALEAGSQIIAIANGLREKHVAPEVDPEEPLIYDPYRDRIITAGNGYDENNAKSAIQQSVVNEALSQLIQPPTGDNPRLIIDAGMVTKKFSVGHRVMATRNESPNTKDRVTNGMVGVIMALEKNIAWDGDWHHVGPENEVKEHKKRAIDELMGKGGGTDSLFGDESDSTDWSKEIEGLQNGDFGSTETEEEERDSKEGSGPASHKVSVEFANGAIRTFSSKAGVGSLQLAYASTCHKCQGSQFDTAIIVCHHLEKQMLCREWLYTAVTRAQKRVIFLYTKHGIRCALNKQRIFGRTLQEKIERYKALAEENALIKMNRVRLSVEE